MTAKQERILRVLLNFPKGTLSSYRIAKEAKCSRSWVIEFLHKLEKKGLVVKKHIISKNKRDIEAILVSDVMGIYRYWVGISHPSYIREYNVQDPLDILKNIGLKYALTTYQAENLLQNYLFPARIDFYVKGKDAETWHKKLTENGLVGRGNVKLLIGDDHIFYKNKIRKKLRIVSTPQLIVDLLREGGIAEEAGLMLMKKGYHGIISEI